jgi:hypothetical protein
MTTLRVVQTRAAFGYAVGKVWGPYAALADALERVQTLRRHKGDGKVQAGDWKPCRALKRPAAEWPDTPA